MSIKDDLWDMSDEDLEKAYKEAVANQNSPETEAESVDEDAFETESIDETDSDNEEFDDSETADDSEHEEDGSDQPEDLLEESDHDASEEAEDDEVDEEDTSEADDDNPDEDSDSEKEESSEDTEESKEDLQQPRSYTFRANGKDYEFSSEEIVDQFPKIFGQAMDYTKKMQTIKPWRKTIDALQEAKLSHEDVNLMIDVLKGDKDAVTEVLKRTGVDTLELDTEKDSEYVAKDYGRDEGALAISDIVDEISKDPEYAMTHNILSNEWDDKSWETVAENPEMIRLLHTDVKSGVYAKIQPLAEKLKVFGGGTKSDLEYYKEAAQKHFSEAAAARQRQYAQKVEEENANQQQEASNKKKARVEKAKTDSNRRAATKKAAAKRKAATPTKKVSSNTVVDYLDESDESFDEWYKKLQDSM